MPPPEMRELTSRAAYRVRQFWRTLFPAGKALEGARFSPYLTPAQFQLFQRMHPAEQAHACSVFQKLQLAGHHETDLLVAALLHDVGKIRAPLTLLERVIIVLAWHIKPQLVDERGLGEPMGMNRPFVVAKQHPAWGAELAAEAGASARACELIRDHQGSNPAGDPLLSALQEVDDQS